MYRGDPGDTGGYLSGLYGRIQVGEFYRERLGGRLSKTWADGRGAKSCCKTARVISEEMG